MVTSKLVYYLVSYNEAMSVASKIMSLVTVGEFNPCVVLRMSSKVTNKTHYVCSSPSENKS